MERVAGRLAFGLGGLLSISLPMAPLRDLIRDGGTTRLVGLGLGKAGLHLFHARGCTGSALLPLRRLLLAAD
ncbi:MAG: hypothetical protein VXU47_04530, partial [Pseudomonadota bacterium]|nr:hypothetical protein [Pseudomonadota bacterium]